MTQTSPGKISGDWNSVAGTVKGVGSRQGQRLVSSIGAMTDLWAAEDIGGGQESRKTSVPGSQREAYALNEEGVVVEN